MATFLIRQKRKFGGVSSTATINFEGTDTECQNFVNDLGGEVSILEESKTITHTSTTDVVDAGDLVIDGISMIHSEAKTAYIGAYGKPIVFTGVTVPQLQQKCEEMKPYKGSYEAEKPDSVNIKVGSARDLM